ncbi:MAG: HAD-IB family hydrolase, partial [Microbacteriaceae bacterium]
MDEKRLVFFDVDNTLVKGACLYYFAIEAYRHKYLSFSDILRFARKNLSFIAMGENKAHLKQVQHRALALLEGTQVAGVQQLAKYANQKRIIKQF